MKFNIKLELDPAEEGFIQNLKDKHAARQKEKGRRYSNPSQTFPNVDAALAYAKEVYVGDSYPYYLALDVANDKIGFIFNIRKKNDAEVSLQDIQTCISKAQSNWKRVLKAVAAAFYDSKAVASEDFAEIIDKKTVSKSQFVASCRFNGISVFPDRSGNHTVEYEFYSSLMSDGWIVEDVDGLGDFHGTVDPQYRD